MSKKTKLTDFQRRALVLLRDRGPLRANAVGEALWPDKDFKNAQGAGFAGGAAMGKLTKLGWVRMEYGRPDLQGRAWPQGYILTVKGRVALKNDS